jgi:drug/metabolite transporter (DMT)-like permease
MLQSILVRNGRGYAALFITILIWGTTLFATKVVLREVRPLQLTFIRFLIASLMLALLAARQGFRLKQIIEPKFILFGLTGTVLYYTLLNIGMTYTSVSSTSMILAIIPALTTILAVIFLKERLNRLQVAGLLLVTAGVVLVSLDGSVGADSSRPLLGNLLIFACSLAWAVYTIQGRVMSIDTPAIVATAASTGASALMLLPFAGWDIYAHGLPQSFSLEACLGILYLSLVGSGLSMFLWNYALKYLSASLASAYLNLVPVIGLASSYLLGEHPPLVQIAGGGLAILGVLLSSRTHKAGGD